MLSMKGLFYICEFLEIAPKDFFDDQTKSPELLAEVINECKGLDRQSLKGLLEFIRNIRK